MASVQKTARGYRVQVYTKGVRDSATFRTKREADAWAARREVELLEQSQMALDRRYTVADMLRRYRDEVTPTKRGARWEEVRINMFLASEHFPASLLLADASSDAFGRWRDVRLAQVKPGSVLREIGVISAAFETARREWKWVAANPIRDVRRPSTPEHRDVVISRSQIRGMLRSLGYSRRGGVTQVRHVVAVAFLVSLRTGMRAGELCGLDWARVHADYCRLPVTKTVARNVPLSRKARALIERMRGWDGARVFDIPPATLDAMFRKYRERAELGGFTFHDSRHTAATWLARKLDVLDLCKAFGWRDPKRAMIYYNPTASQMAARMN
jgi:integrase